MLSVDCFLGIVSWITSDQLFCCSVSGFLFYLPYGIVSWITSLKSDSFFMFYNSHSPGTNNQNHPVSMYSNFIEIKQNASRYKKKYCKRYIRVGFLLLVTK
uniref:Uncharacterized protein n=1 Tax=Cacopsylla melanoneura TaxID=428564 RepID=A0A8D8R808_9HEMI